MSRYGVEVEPATHGADLTLVIEGMATTVPLTRDQVERLITALYQAVPELRADPEAPMVEAIMGVVSRSPGRLNADEMLTLAQAAMVPSKEVLHEVMWGLINRGRLACDNDRRFVAPFPKGAATYERLPADG